MTFSRAVAIPVALVVVLAVVGAWMDGSESSSAPSAGSLVGAPVPTSVAPGAAATVAGEGVAGTPAATAVPATTAPGAAAPAAATAPAPPAVAATRSSCTSVVHVGDSTSVGLMSSSYIDDPALRIDAQYARVGVTDFRDEIRGARSIIERYHGEENADEVATRQKAAGYEGCWVLALGTTDSANINAGANAPAAARIDTMMSIIGDDPVLWVNVKTLVSEGDAWAESGMVAWNAAVAEAAGRYPNLRVYDWAAVVQDAWFQDDGIHYTSAGNVERARLIADALMATYPG